jgi:ribosomal protein S19
MSRSLKKGPFVADSLLKKINFLNANNIWDFIFIK